MPPEGFTGVALCPPLEVGLGVPLPSSGLLLLLQAIVVEASMSKPESKGFGPRAFDLET